MSDILPTVKIKSDGPKGYRIINESAFDPEVHERFDVPAGSAKQEQGSIVDLDHCTVPQLRNIAEERGVVLGAEYMKKADIIAKIEAAKRAE